MSYLPPTKLQTRILQEYVDVKGFGEGQRRLYHRLKNDIGERDHPAMDVSGNVAYDEDGKVLELMQDQPSTRDNTYFYQGKEYKYETRVIYRFGKESIERRKLLPTQRAIAEFLRRNASHQIDRNTRKRPAAGTKTAPKAAPQTAPKTATKSLQRISREKSQA